MPYLSLYRKYRPRSFAEVIGQRHVTQTLANAVKANRIAHAYLFCGPRGTGKTSTALALAMSLNCDKGPTPEPCRECEICGRIMAGSALDVFEFDAASHRSVEDIGEVLERVSLAPAEARVKVYIIDEVHMLSGTAFNAFLKTLEEPPAHVVFVLATTEPHRVIPTILSRCQRFDFHRVGVRDIEENIRKITAAEGIEIDEKAIAMLAHAADGSVRDSLTLLDQAFAYAEEAITPEVVTEILGGIEFDLLAEFTEVLLGRDISGALALIERVVGEGKDLRQLVEGLLWHYRNLLLLRVDRRGRDAIVLPEESVKRTAEQANSVSAEEIVRVLDLFAETDRELRFTSQPRLLLELCAVRICEPPKAAEAAAPAGRKEREAARKPAPGAPAEAEVVAEEVKEEAAGPVGLADLKRRWDEVLGGLRKERQGSVAAFLREAVPVGLEGDVVTLAFNHQFHYDQMMKGEERRKAAGDAIARVFRREMTVKYEMGTEPARAEGPGEQEEVKDYLSMFPGSELEEE
ncbi:MAG: DNA polymerase III subunit gamma/tau [Armatimonadota bacterium]|nr:MAG: DNA polymerase III subunit gamma/tau [Armatimonadota bacterium]